MADRSRGDADRPPRRRRRLRRLALALLVLALLFYAGGGWYFSDLLHERALSGEARRASTTFDPTTEVVAVQGDPTAGSPASVTLAVTDEAGSVDVDGTWGLRWDGGYGQVGGIVRRDEDTVTRALLVLQGDLPEAGDPAELDFRAWPAPPTEEPVRNVLVPGPLGEYPAWFVPGDPDAEAWAIVVHGNAMTRTDGVRVLPILENAGIPSLTITYRNDPGAPEDPSGLLRYGLTEWPDLEAAVAYAMGHGAEGLVLMGHSMGGAVVMAFLARSDLADEVTAVVLDAPVLDLSATVDHGAAHETLPVVELPLPSSLTVVAKWIADIRFDIRWDELDYLEDTRPYREVPFLVFHGTGDRTVPIATSRRFSRLEPDLVTLIECPEADHLECWNVDATRYSQQLTAFLADAGATA